MKPKTIYIIVEGPHDSSVVGAVIRRNGLNFKPISLREEVDKFWDDLIPSSFPGENDEGKPEFGRVQVPDFFKTADQLVAVQFAGGIDKIPRLLKDDLELLEIKTKRPDAIGIIIDADSSDAAAAHAALKLQIDALNMGVLIPDAPGSFAEAPHRLGVFVLPNNSRQGTLEDTMLECAAVAYPQLCPIANTAVASVSNAFDLNPNWLPDPEHRDFKKPAGPNKARAGMIGSVLKPTYAIGNSYRQQNWITEDTLKLPLLAQLSSFLSSLVGEW
jgi:hypothetical protein